jgi:hypothetical protein
MISESSDDRRRTVKRKKDKRRHKRMEKEEREMDDYNRDSFKKMKQEIEELRKKEKDREKELENLRHMIESKEKEKESKSAKIEYALGFDKDEYLKKGFIESAKWLKDVVAVNLSEKIKDEKFEAKFESILTAKKSSIHLGMRTCARFNRGEECNLGRWHMTHKEVAEPMRPKQLWTRNHQQQQFGQLPPRTYESSTGGDLNSRRNEIRLHVCTLCLDAFGAAFGHSTLNCPWILKKNWKEDENL